MNTAIIQHESNYNRFIQAIDNDVNLSPATSHQYKREITKAVDNGVNLLDAHQVQQYAITLPKSSKAFLKAAIKKLSKQMELDIKGQATPDNIAQTQAALMRFEALNESIKVKKTNQAQGGIWLTPKEVKTLMSQINGRLRQRDTIALSLLLGAGLRRVELTRLKFGDMTKQGDRMTLQIDGKGSKRRFVPISTALEQRLIEYQKFVGASKNDHVIDCHSSQIFKMVNRYGKMIDKPKLAPHDLRRTFAQIAYDNGVPIVQISKNLGHSSVAVTQRYLNTAIDLKVAPSDFVPI